MKRLFVDMDGTLTEWRTFKYEFYSLEDIQNIQKLIYQKLNEENYFYNLKPHQNVVDAVKQIIRENNDIEVYILSAVISERAEADKNRWLDKYIPEIDRTHRIFTIDGQDKKMFVPDGIRPDDYLLDDRTINLTDWEPPAKGIKLLNGINHTNGTWINSRLNYEKDSTQLASDIFSIIYNNEKIMDEKPINKIQTVEIKPITVDAKEQYLSIIKSNNFKAFEWSLPDGGKCIFHPSVKDGDWQLSFISSEGIPVRDTQWMDKDIGTGTIDDVIMLFPHSDKENKVRITVLFDNSITKNLEQDNDYLGRSNKRIR